VLEGGGGGGGQLDQDFSRPELARASGERSDAAVAGGGCLISVKRSSNDQGTPREAYSSFPKIGAESR